MKYNLIDEKYIYEYIKDILLTCKLELTNIDTNLYHHNSSYKNGVSILKNGLLSLNDINNNIKKIDNNSLKLLSDEYSHINGIHGISLSIMGLKDLYKSDEEYIAYLPHELDFLISREIIADRRTYNYGNEFISYNNIPNTMFKSLDIRLSDCDKLSYISKLNVLNYYNYLIDIAKFMEYNKSNIPLREMSSNMCFDIDISVFSKQNKLLLKK